MVLNPHRYAAALDPREDRHARAGCLMAATFFLPLLANKLNSVVLFSAFFIYIGLIVPLLLSYITLGSLFHGLKAIINVVCSTLQWMTKDPIGKLWCIFIFLWEFFLGFQRFYFELESFRTTCNQVMFFMLAEKYFCPKDRLACLYALLFYTILAYLKKSLKTRQWSQVFQTSSVTDLLRMTSTFLAVRLGKAVATTAVLMMFTMQFNDHEPNFTFITITLLYFAFTQYPEKRPDILARNDVVREDAEEIKHLWLPLGAKITAVVMSTVLILTMWHRHSVICMIAVYTNVMVPAIDLFETYVAPLAQRTQMLAAFRLVSRAELAASDVCPICLDALTSLARVTPCNHVFHGNCLFRCLTVTNLCPMCKRCIVDARTAASFAERRVQTRGESFDS